MPCCTPLFAGNETPSPLLCVFMDDDLSNLILKYVRNDNLFSILPVSKNFYVSAFHTFFKPAVIQGVMLQIRKATYFLDLNKECERLTEELWRNKWSAQSVKCRVGKFLLRMELTNVEEEILCFPELEREYFSVRGVQRLDAFMFNACFGGKEGM